MGSVIMLVHTLATHRLGLEAGHTQPPPWQMRPAGRGQRGGGGQGGGSKASGGEHVREGARGMPACGLRGARSQARRGEARSLTHRRGT